MRTPYEYNKIETERDINKTRLAFTEDGHYGAGISDCYVVGINGDCGETCPVLLRGDCESDDEEFISEMEAIISETEGAA